MQITKTLQEPVAGETQVGLCSCSEIGPILQGMISSLQAGGLLNHVGGCSQSNYPHCVYTVPIRAAGLPVWTQGCVDTYSINTSLERFFISLDVKKSELRARNVIPHRGFSFLFFSFQSRYKAPRRAKTLLFLLWLDISHDWVMLFPQKQWLVPIKIVWFLRKLFQKSS